ncbi:transcription initiation factor TFIID component TAF4 [Mycena rosella]|uniref:Transcription initiation factor TFIID subunit 4 n=1 Tax=Mycena rosella TaxID=1033263 RepID=A0AAD7GLJ9_MYCRO|nr:transcription initiation factor TFIID component TAF4 [Mycena rosella]
MARQAIANVQQQHSSSGALDTADVATLNDALGSAGVDLRAEEEGLQRSHDHPQSFRPFEDRAHKQPPRPHFDAGFLAASMRAVAAHHKVASIPEECVTYLALALRARLQDLVAGMIAAARHRARAQWDREAGLYEDGRAAWDVRVRADVAKQLEALERAERGEEARARRERAVERALEALVAGEELDAPLEIPVDDPMEGDARRRRKKAKGAGAGPEEVEGREMAAANKEAGRAAGIMGRYAWLTAAGSRPTPSAGAGAGATPPRETLRPYKATKRAPTPPPLPPDADQRMPISIRDAMFAVEKERGHGGGRGAARGWT